MKIKLTIFYIVIIAFCYNTVFAQPVINSFSPLSARRGGVVTILGSGFVSPLTVYIGGVPAMVLSNNSSQIKAQVAEGATSSFVRVTTNLGSHNAIHNISIDTTTPSFTQSIKLIGTNVIGYSQQGASVSLDANGNTAVVGGYLDNAGKGAAWIYSKDASNNWHQQAKLVPNNLVGASNFGGSVSLSADGNTVLIGGFSDNGDEGAAWIFTRSDTTWTQQAKLVGLNAINGAQQGYAVSISADGNTALIGGPRDNNSIGAVWVFVKTGNFWIQQGQKLIATGGVGASRQGCSASLSANANAFIIGGTDDNGSFGAVWIFEKNANTWTQQGSKIVGTTSTTVGTQGMGVSMNATGLTAIMSAPGDSSGFGSAWVFNKNGSVWQQQSKLKPTGMVGPPIMGYSLQTNALANIGVCGAPFDDLGTGAVWVFIKDNFGWKQYLTKLVGSGNFGNAQQGTSVAISADGSTIITGGIYDNGNQGAVWIFSSSSLPLKLLTFNIEKKDQAVRLDWSTDNEYNAANTIIEFSTNAYRWVQIGKLSNNNKSGKNEYQFLHKPEYEDLMESNLFYRLKFTDIDGKFSYSPIRKIVTSIELRDLMFNPNPSNGIVTLTVKAFSTEGTIYFMDICGKILKQQRLVYGKNVVDISIFPKGTYLISVTTEHSMLSQKIALQ